MADASVVAVLRAALDTQADVREHAEKQIEAAMGRPGFAPGILAVALDQASVEDGVRQLAAILLKKYVTTRWSPAAGDFVAPGIAEEEKHAIRSAVLGGLADPSSKVRTLLSAAVAAIADFDWPEQWPDLMPQLLAAVQTKRSPASLQGALQCLSVVAEDLDDGHLPDLMAALAPEVAAAVSPESGHATSVRTTALSILCHLLRTLSFMTGKAQRAVRDASMPHTCAVLGHVAALVGPAPDPDDEDSLHLHTTARRVATLAVPLYLKHPQVHPAAPALLSAAVEGLGALVGPFEITVVLPEDGDEHTAASALDALVCQHLELVVALLGRSALAEALAPAAGRLALATGRLMQLTVRQEADWGRDAGHLVGEDTADFGAPRAAGELVLEAAVEAYDAAGVAAVVGAYQELHAEAGALEAAGRWAWAWRRREAALSMAGTLLGSLAEQEEAGIDVGLNTAHLAGEVVARDLTPDAFQRTPFVVCRALCLLSRIGAGVPDAMVPTVVHAAAAVLGTAGSPPLQWGGLRGLAAFVPRCPRELVSAVLPQVYPALGSLLHVASDDSMEWVLEALRVVVGAVPEAAATFEGEICGAIMGVWYRHTNDPVLAPACQDVLCTLIGIPQCQEGVLQRVLPTLRQLLVDPTALGPEVPANGQEAALDMLGAMVTRASLPGARLVHSAVFEPAVRLATTSADAGVVQCAVVLVKLLVAAGGPAFRDWEGAGGQSATHAVLKVLEVLLDPKGDEQAAAYAGTLLSQLIATLPDQLSPILGDVLHVIVRRLDTATVPFFIVNVIDAVARLVHLACDDLIATLASTPVDGQDRNGLGLVMRRWTSHQGDVQGAYRIKLTTTALMKLLQCPSEALDAVTVPGRIVDANPGRIRTRSMARSQGAEQWVHVSLRAKIVMLLAEVLVEAREQGGDAADGDSEWETEDDEGEGHGAMLSSIGGGGLDVKGQGLDLCDVLDDQEDVDETKMPLGHETIYLRGTEEGDPVKDVSLVAEIGSLVRHMVAQGHPVLQEAHGHLTQAQVVAVQEVMRD